jgi:hypothetical protein
MVRTHRKMVLPPSPAPWDDALPYFRFHERRYRLLLDVAAKSLARSARREFMEEIFSERYRQLAFRSHFRSSITFRGETPGE